MSDPLVPISNDEPQQSAGDPFSGAMRVGIAAAHAAGSTVEVNGRPYSVVRQDDRIGLEQVGTDADLPRPLRARGAHTVRNVESFIAYIQRYQSPATTVWAGLDGSMKAVIDDHEPSAESLTPFPGWGDHAVTFERIQTPEFAAWRSIARDWVKQLEFAEFLEDRYLDIAGEEAAEVLQMAKLLVAKRSLEFRSGQVLQTGAVDFMYSETISGQVREGQTTPLPTSFMVEVQPFQGMDATVALNARLRWRIDGQALKFLVVFSATEMQEELDAIAARDMMQVATETGITPFLGA